MSSEKSTYVQLGPRKWEIGGEYLKWLEPCNECLAASDVAIALKDQLNQKGYIYLKHVLPKDEVLRARLAVLEYIQHLTDTNILKKPVFSSSYVDGILSSGCTIGCVPFMEGKNSITNHPAVLNIIENSFLYYVFTCLFDGVRPITFDYKWLRGMHHNGNTGCHMDRVYMNRGSSKLLTCWIPFDDLTIDMSVLAVLEGSHRMDRSVEDDFMKLQNTYGNLDVERDQLQGTGWFTDDPMEFYHLNNQCKEDEYSNRQQSTPMNPIWKTTEYSAGDILIFTMRTIHMSSVNLTNKLRVSCDTRWQPYNEPIDSRFMQVGIQPLQGHTENKFGLHQKDIDNMDDEKTTIKQWRKKWGFMIHRDEIKSSSNS